MKASLTAFGFGSETPDPFAGQASLPAPEDPQLHAACANEPRDADGLVISRTYQPIPARWATLPYKTRKTLSDGYCRDLIRRSTKKPRAARAHGTAYTTDAAIAWGKAKGWTVLQRERFGATHAKGQIVYRREDCAVGSDVMFATPGGIVLVQAAGPSERTPHYERFLTRGGIDKCRELHAAFLYVEFERGNDNPIKEEKWA